MSILKKQSADTITNRTLIIPTLTVVFSIALLIVAPLLNDYFVNIMNTTNFLSWHNILEITGIIACFSIFMVSLYTYRQEQNIKAIVVGSLLATAGIIDGFHMLSYKGMPDFFIANVTANRATTFWIAARIFSVLAYLASAIMSNEKKSTINRYLFAMASLVISFAVFTAVTYFPDLLPAMYVEGSGLTFAKKLAEYIIIAITAIVAIIYFDKYMKTKRHVLYIMLTALILSILSEFSFTIYINVYGIYNFIGHIFKCISLFMIFRVTFSKYVLAPYTAMAVAQKELRDYADNLDKLIEIRTGELKRINERLIEDLEFARDIQKSMLPSFFPNSSHVSFNSLYRPAERLSGDFYDVFWLDESHIGFYVCDVSGHGVPAAMLTVFLKQCIGNIIEADRLKGTLSSPSYMMSQVYNAFNNTNFRDEVYIVLIYFTYDTKTKKLVFCSAGMNEKPVLVNAKGKLRDIDIKGFPICKLRELYDAAYKDTELYTGPGDKLLVYTDGLIELRNNNEKQYTAERLRLLLSKNGRKPSENLIAAIKNDLKVFAGARSPDDDITLLCVEFR